MVTLTIDNKKISVPEGTTIMKAAASVGIMIPHLCYLEGINEISACKVCVVEMQGKTKLITACNNPVEEGMVLYTNSPKVRAVRRTNVELILSQHNSNCATCVRSGNCELQKLSNDLGIIDITYKKEIMEMPWNRDFPLIRDFGKCIKCMRCVQICDKVQDLHIDVENTGSRTTVMFPEPEDRRIDCASADNVLPIVQRAYRNGMIPQVFRALADPETITVVVAPAVRAAWRSVDLPAYGHGRAHGAALKKIGFDYVFDTNFPQI
ncbi:MAG: 2Fe-2S iron-sulfur cluster-binding protein [Eisenbergiella sp.]